MQKRFENTNRIGIYILLIFLLTSVSVFAVDTRTVNYRQYGTVVDQANTNYEEVSASLPFLTPRSDPLFFILGRVIFETEGLYELDLSAYANSQTLNLNLTPAPNFDQPKSAGEERYGRGSCAPIVDDLDADGNNELVALSSRTSLKLYTFNSTTNQFDFTDSITPAASQYSGCPVVWRNETMKMIVVQLDGDGVEVYNVTDGVSPQLQRMHSQHSGSKCSEWSQMVCTTFDDDQGTRVPCYFTTRTPSGGCNSGLSLGQSYLNRFFLQNFSLHTVLVGAGDIRKETFYRQFATRKVDTFSNEIVTVTTESQDYFATVFIENESSHDDVTVVKKCDLNLGTSVIGLGSGIGRVSLLNEQQGIYVTVGAEDQGSPAVPNDLIVHQFNSNCQGISSVTLDSDTWEWTDPLPNEACSPAGIDGGIGIITREYQGASNPDTLFLHCIEEGGNGYKKIKIGNLEHSTAPGEQPPNRLYHASQGFAQSEGSRRVQYVFTSLGIFRFALEDFNFDLIPLFGNDGSYDDALVSNATFSNVSGIYPLDLNQDSLTDLMMWSETGTLDLLYSDVINSAPILLQLKTPTSPLCKNTSYDFFPGVTDDELDDVVVGVACGDGTSDSDTVILSQEEPQREAQLTCSYQNTGLFTQVYTVDDAFNTPQTFKRTFQVVEQNESCSSPDVFVVANISASGAGVISVGEEAKGVFQTIRDAFRAMLGNDPESELAGWLLFAFIGMVATITLFARFGVSGVSLVEGSLVTPLFILLFGAFVGGVGVVWPMTLILVLVVVASRRLFLAGGV